MDILFTRETPAFTLVGKSEPDRMKLFVDVELKEGGKATRDTLLKELRQEIGEQTIDVAVIDSIINQLAPGKKIIDRRILKGTKKRVSLINFFDKPCPRP